MLLTQQEKADLFNGHTRLAHHIAGIFARKYHKPFDDVDTEALSLLGEACASLNEMTEKFPASRKCNLTSILYRVLYWELSNFYGRPKEKAKTFSVTQTDPTRLQANNKDWLQELLADISTDAQIIVHTIINAPAEIAEELSPVARIRSRRVVQEHLLKTGWSKPRLHSAWNEVAECLA